ncbi:unnamed protein product (macronuclear) [Paramecium tetraurelia]|uniref:PRA1 family protein n=1 Tax=Paramecium tetraurelia TaxID=5888 RepID=A0DSG5_PARTE|nr:uncharacterized protein GSPATT00019686001 [Paramecium tetraurelia]CAK85982.1 unnamed protein product [Paramecium tetraurelia]|eukprot:XP_001453379.1 hypothetical protein (macronuclear) [Paramecium tetraurelia strain d4-2]
MNQVHQVLQKPQIDKKIFDTSSYALPKSDSIMTRLQENFSKFGATYSQFTIAIVVLGGLTNISFLISVGLSIALYGFYIILSWYAALKNDDLLDYIPNFGFLSTDKKKVLLFLLNVLVLYIFCGDSIFTYIGVGFLISFLHSFLFVSPSTGALIDGQTQQQTGQDLSQYVNFSNNNNIELQCK